MTQEMCKDFLAGSSNRDAAARQRYKLYQKATGLEQSNEGLTRAIKNVEESSERLQVRRSMAISTLLCECLMLVGHEVGRTE